MHDFVCVGWMCRASCVDGKGREKIMVGCMPGVWRRQKEVRACIEEESMHMKMTRKLEAN